MKETDDFTGAYLKIRQDANLTPAQQRLQETSIDTVDTIGKSKFNFFSTDVLNIFYY